MTDSFRNLLIILSITFGIPVLVHLWFRLFDWWKGTHPKITDTDLREDNQDYIRWFPAPLPPRNFNEYSIQLKGECTESEKLKFAGLVHNLEKGLMPVSVAEAEISDYVAECRRERRLIDRDILRVVGSAIAFARQRRDESQNTRMYNIISNFNMPPVVVGKVESSNADAIVEATLPRPKRSLILGD